MDNYKEKYENALDWMRGVYDTLTGATKEDAERFFPELKESNDERMKKSIIGFLRTLASLKDGKTVSNEDFDSNALLAWADWLENQGEQTDDANEQYWRGYREGKQEILDKYAEIENQSGQKPADKAETKFHEGEWVVQEGAGIYKIIEVCESWYEVIDTKDNHYSIGFDKECMCHLWTIEDAKDGDVLTWDDNKCIALFKNIYNKESFRSHGYVGHCTGIFEPCSSFHDIECVHPATQEQCGLLFQKMKEAGYEWDVEKKELKKIEQKSDECNEEEDTELTDFESTLFTAFSYAWQSYLAGEEVDVAAWAKENSTELLKVARKSAEWSEEDESAWIRIIDAIEQEYTESEAEELKEWLKSLKPQKQWKPSEEQMKDLSLAATVKTVTCPSLKSLYNDLKKL